MFSLHEDVLSDVENVLVDGGYSGDPFANNVRKASPLQSRGCKTERALLVQNNSKDGLWNVLSPGWRSAVGYGKIAKESLILRIYVRL